MKRADVLWIIILTLYTSLFFVRMFYPHATLIVTPDFGRSDAWHFSFPTKYALWESLQELTLPLWRSDIGTGFPLFAEGQTGALFAVNLLLFTFFPPVSAYNLALILTVITLALGTYWWARELKIESHTSAFAALSIGFSALTMTQLTHITLLQGMSVLPLLGAATMRLFKKRTALWIAVFAILLSQQIFAGFPQAVFITLLICLAQTAWTMYSEKKLITIFLFLSACLVGVAAGGIQIIPSYEFLQASTNPSGFNEKTAMEFSMPVKHFITFLSPFALGNPKFGSYPPFFEFDGSIFWENTAYVGILTVLLTLIALLKYRRNGTVQFFGLTLVFSLLLAFGKHAPTYFLYGIWPMTLFRVPSRFLWLTMFALVFLGAKTLDLITKKLPHTSGYLTLFLIIAVQAVSVTAPWWHYHAYGQTSEWLTIPATGKKISDGRIFTIGAQTVHNEVFLKHGWENIEQYKKMREYIAPNSNIPWGITHTEIYAGRYLARQAIFQQLILESFAQMPKESTVSSKTFLDLSSSAYIISKTPVKGDGLKPVQESAPYIYKNLNALPRARFVYEATSAATLNQALSIMKDQDFDYKTTVLLEDKDIRDNPQLKAFTNRDKKNTPSADITWQEDSHTRISLSVSVPEPALMIVSDTFYPGWSAMVDGTFVPIIPANLNQRAIMIPGGSHSVTFMYEPKSLYVGGLVSLMGFLIIAGLIVSPAVLGAFRTPFEARLHARPHPGNLHKS